MTHDSPSPNDTPPDVQAGHITPEGLARITQHLQQQFYCLMPDDGK